MDPMGYDFAINHEDFKRFEEANMVISPQEFGIHQRKS